jgi:hypothetical protein
MTDVQEVYEMVTKQKPPEPGALERQHTRQVRMARNRKVGAIAVAATIGLVALIAVLSNDGDGTGTQVASSPSETTEPFQAVPGTEGVSIEPGRYAIGTLSPLDESHTITIDIPDGYVSFNESIVFKDDVDAGTGVGLWGVGWVFADACQWRGTASPTSSTDDVVAALQGEEGLRVSTPTPVTIDGYAGTYVEVTVASQAALDGCDDEHFGAFALAGDTPKGVRHFKRVDEPELLWILDVDGQPLVIDALATEQERAELEQMVASIQIEPVS